MTATADPRAEVGGPRDGALDRARGIELLGDLEGSGRKDGSWLVRRENGQVVQLGPLLYALLECLDGRRGVPALADCLSERLGRRFGEEHVVRLAEKLAARGLLAGSEANAPVRKDPLLGLRYKVLVTNPRVTSRLTAPFTFLFRPWVVWPALALFAAVLAFVLVEKGLASATREAFGKPELLLLVFLLGIGSAGFHEIGHAAACRYSGGRPGGMGMGLYMIWPAFYTDVTDAYRLPRRDRLRVDLGGLYFNALVSVGTVGAWLLWRNDALLLLVALQLIQMVKQLSPVIRADGYHILSDLTGIPDLYAHIGPTLRRLIPWRPAEPSALTGRARAIVTAWVLVAVPALLALALTAILLLPRLLATAWASGSEIAGGLDEGTVEALTASLRLLALALPVLGGVVLTYTLGKAAIAAAKTWSSGRPVRQGVLGAAATAGACLAALAWWPAGQYQPIQASERGTLLSLARAVASPQAVVRPVPATAQLEPGTQLAAVMVPDGGATAERPALLVLRDENGEAVVVLADEVPDVGDPSTHTTATGEQVGVALPFRLPAAPGPGGTQAVAVGTQDGAVTYQVAYALVTVRDGAPVTNTNSAFAFASCNACTTVAVSLQIVLVVGTSDVVVPINAAGALNVECPACVTVAIAKQLVVTLSSEPTEELRRRLEAALAELDALPDLGRDLSRLLAEIAEVETEVRRELEESGLLAKPASSTATTTTGAATSTPTTTTGTTTTAPATTTATATTPAPPPATTAATTTTTATTTTQEEAPPPPPEEPPPTTTGATTTTGG